jgi:hypothetical protein
MLSLLPLDVPEDCNCCNDALNLRWHGVARKLDFDVSMQALKEDGIVEEDGEDAFLDDELAIAAALSTAWATAVDYAKPIILKSIETAYSPGNLQSAIDTVTPTMTSVFDKAAKEVTSAVNSAMGIGTSAMGGGGAGGSGYDIPLMSTPSARQFEQAIIGATRYSTNRYFNTQIVPNISAAIDAAFHRIDAPSLTDLQAAIAYHFRTVPYWELIANLAASRGYHYGYLRTMQARGIIGYQFVAVIDGKTSAICRSMNGREFLVADAVNLMDGLANDPDPMAGRTRTPWVRAAAVEGQSSADLTRMGVMVPPLHPRCRSTINPIY